MENQDKQEIQHLKTPAKKHLGRARHGGQESRNQNWKKSKKKQFRKQTRQFQKRLLGMQIRGQ